MNKTNAMVEVFVTAFRSLPQKERKNIAQKLLADLDAESFTINDWEKIEKIAEQRGEFYTTGKQAKQHLNKL
ncbi:MAG: hypothetical protein PHX78_05145 [bacterium]|nr:hypothetical protein [bacterium]